MERMWDSIKRSLQDGAAIAFDKAEAYTHVGRARLDVAAAKTRLARLKGELGTVVFSRMEAGQGAGLADDGEINDRCDRIREAVAGLEAADQEFNLVRQELQPDEEPEDDTGGRQ
jgi:hypothetical protein